MARKETPEQAKAYQMYYALGAERSYGRVAERLGVHVNTVKAWGARFGWGKRVEETDLLVTGDVVEVTARATVKAKEQSREINQILKDRFHEKVKKDEVEIRTIRDYIEIDKHDLLVRGEATERRESVSLELKGHVRDILNSIGKRVEEMGAIDAEFTEK